MDRPRRISTALLNCPELRDVSAEAEVLAHRLSLACDDFGRARLDGDAFAKKLFPRHPEARGVIDHWCKELKESGFIERYRVGTEDYIRLLRWDEDQAIEDPRPSDLPRSPTEKARPASQVAKKPAVQEAVMLSTPASASPAPVLPVVSSPPAKTGARAAKAPDDEPGEDFDALVARLRK